MMTLANEIRCLFEMRNLKITLSEYMSTTNDCREKSRLMTLLCTLYTVEPRSVVSALITRFIWSRIYPHGTNVTFHPFISPGFFFSLCPSKSLFLFIQEIHLLIGDDILYPGYFWNCIKSTC